MTPEVKRWDESHRWETHTSPFPHFAFRSLWSFLSVGFSRLDCFLKLGSLTRWWSLKFCRKKESIIELFLNRWRGVKAVQHPFSGLHILEKMNSNFLFYRKCRKHKRLLLGFYPGWQILYYTSSLFLIFNSFAYRSPSTNVYKIKGKSTFPICELCGMGRGDDR